ncbi:MAG: hypothetical protein FWC68_00620 [Oscillospiraceae bacterium]|nr:hypothetical protein [Oscillospiraceae bacterium]
MINLSSVIDMIRLLFSKFNSGNINSQNREDKRRIDHSTYTGGFCNQCGLPYGANSETCSSCGLLCTGNMYIYQLEKVIETGNPQNPIVVSSMTDLGHMYLSNLPKNRGNEKYSSQLSKDEYKIYQKGVKYLQTAAKNGGAAALHTLGIADVSKVADVDDSETADLLALNGLRKLACAHHIGYLPATVALETHMKMAGEKASKIIAEMMEKNSDDLWDWEINSPEVLRELKS